MKVLLNIVTMGFILMSIFAFANREHLYPFLSYNLYSRNLKGEFFWKPEFYAKSVSQEKAEKILTTDSFFDPFDAHTFFVSIFFHSGFCENGTIFSCREKAEELMSKRLGYINSKKKQKNFILEFHLVHELYHLKTGERVSNQKEKVLISVESSPE